MVVVVCKKREKQLKNQEKKLYFNERQCKIDNLICGFLKTEYVKYKKYVLMLNQTRIFARVDTNAITGQNNLKMKPRAL